MTRRFLSFLMLALAGFLAANSSLCAETTNAVLAKAVVLENDVAYFRVGEVATNLANEINTAGKNWSDRTNPIVGRVLDLRFADGNDSAAVKTIADWFEAKKLPLAILINGDTRDAALTLAKTLRTARAGLVFGNPAGDFQPDILIPESVDAERTFLQNPYETLSQSNQLTGASNNFLPYVDHTSEADLIREHIKDGDQYDDDSEPPSADKPQKPFIRDPVLARALDLLKGLAIVRQSRF
jgi:hypothetical protein